MTKHLRFLFVMLLAMIWSAGWAAVGDTYKLVTSLEELKSGDVVVLTNSTKKGVHKAMGKAVDSKKRKDVTIKIANDEFSYVDGIDEITLEKATDCWYFKSELGYIVSSADAVDVNVKENNSDPETKANISFNNSKYTVTITFGTSKRILTYGGKWWGMYTTSTTNPIKLYKKVVTGNLKSTTLSLGDYANKTFSFTNGISDDAFTTPTATVTPAEATGAVKYTSSDNDIVTVADNGQLSFTNKKFGSATISAQFIATGDYANSNTVTYTVVNKEPQKTATEVTFGDKSQQTITLTEGDVTGVVFPKASEKNNIAGTVSYESSNTDVAEVDADGNVTINGAYGEATITATFTPSGETYAVSTDWYKVVNKVNAAFYESFDKCAGKGGNDGAFSGTLNDSAEPDNIDWSFTKVFAANKCIKFGSSGKGGSATTPAINLSSKGLLTFKVASWAKEQTKVTVSIDNGTLIYNGKEGISFVLSPTDTEWNDINMIISATGSVKVTFVSSERCFLDEVMVKNVAESGETTTITLNENSESNTIEAQTGVNVTLNRSMVANEWNTICLPFDVSKEQATAAFGEGVKIAQLDDTSTGNILNFVDMSDYGMEAAVPYLIKPTVAATSEEYSFKGVEIKEAAVTPTKVKTNGNLYFNGIYNKMDVTTDASSGYYAAFLGANNTIFKAKAGGTMKGFRAYFAIPKSASASALRVVIDGTATSIKNIDSEVLESNAPVYNLQGQRVDGNNLTPSIYVKAGKKFVVK